MTLSLKYAALLLAAFVGGAAAYSGGAQPQPAAPPAVNRPLVFIDPAHGGTETGATLADNALEKNVTLALGNQLRTALTAAGFTVVSTRDGDLTEPLTTDQRAEVANRSHAIACVVLHATGTGSGVHVYTSTLQPLPAQAAGTEDFVPVLWDSAQVEFVGQSLRLSGDLTSALKKANLPFVPHADGAP